MVRIFNKKTSLYRQIGRKDFQAKKNKTPAPYRQSTQVSSDLAEQIPKLKTSNQREHNVNEVNEWKD